MINYWITIFPLSYIMIKNINENINQRIKQKEDIIKINILYKQHLKCLIHNGFDYNKELNEVKYDEYDFKVILENKNIKELECCKKTYIDFIKEYRKFKNYNF